MLEPGGELDLALEPLGAEGGGELGVEHLERDRPVVPEVAREIDRGHAPAAELALERVAVAQPFAQSRYRVAWHVVTAALHQPLEPRVLPQRIEGRDRSGATPARDSTASSSSGSSRSSAFSGSPTSR